MAFDGWLLAGLIFGAAALYSSVGHAGASGYLAAMALFGLAPSEMRPAALLLNIVVAAIGTVTFYRAGCFSGRLFVPLVCGSVPAALLGGHLTLPASVYRPVVGVILLLAALRLVVHKPHDEPAACKRVPRLGVVACGIGVGLLSGLTGTGGGIFLSPVLLFLGWAGPRETAGISAPFIMLNSLAGLAGLLTRSATLPDGMAVWAAAAAVGGWLGSRLSSRHFGRRTLRRLLALVLVIAGGKMLVW